MLCVVCRQDFATYENCQFKYGDDLSPHGGNWTPLTPVDVLDNCSTFINVTFTSSLVNENRTAMVFRGPTRVNLKQSLWLNFSIDTTKREFGAMEFLIFSDWRDLDAMTAAERANYLAQEEAKQPLYTLPAGFRSWVKIYKIMRRDGAAKTNLSDFYLITDFSKYNDPRPLENRTSDPLLVLFEWKSPTYEYIEDILSTTIWNTLGSLAGVFVTLIKAGEYFYAWIKRMRRFVNSTVCLTV
ncbi:Proton-activated chloride channel [Geodia barretti]|uniref:Proton-activated chloride channel n=1 Tax=Geodia barretti TaxID=519541 RepID=A0AA35X8B1_GEOBA|nr:Proton-activated chloride channel [Geodia barretti]